MDYDKIPSAVYIPPENASVGLTEAQPGKDTEP
jgi:pyruvate/2-oxoglutarate dehydrogenase complex dihydrolipoamide dehydrogenase (E3) component